MVYVLTLIDLFDFKPRGDSTWKLRVSILQINL